MSDKIQFTCPQCSHQMKLPSSTVGKQGKCPSCNAVVTITSSQPTDPSANQVPVTPQQPSAAIIPPQPVQRVQQQAPAAVANPTPQPTAKPRKSRWKLLCITHILAVALTIGLMPYWKPHLEPFFPADYLAQNSTEATTPEPELDKTIVNGIGMKLTLIPAGEFQMGSPDSDSDSLPREKPKHLVKISKPFYLAVHEVTQQQYEKVMGARPWQGEENVKEGPDYPAVYVIHDDAVEFCRRLSKQEGVEYRLPTEAEWEYACRAGTTTAYSFGDDEAKLGQYGWYKKNAEDIGDKYAHRVGQKLPNPWGLYDIHGNVWEWCQDRGGPYGSEKVVSDPVGPAEGGRRVLRGGSFSLPSWYARSAHRVNSLPDNRFSSNGFRAARTYHLSP